MPEGDNESVWIAANMPPMLKEYCDWHHRSAIRPHPIFALVSGLLFIQAVVGRGIALPSGLRCNLWILLLAPTESGKGDVPRLAGAALAELAAAKIFPAVPHFEEAFGSAEGLWWHMETVPQVILADEELAKTLTAIIAAHEGTPRYAMRRALLVLHDAAKRAHVAPIRYSKRSKGTVEMEPLRFPFLSIVGTGVPRDIGSFSGAAADDGLLNRFMPIVVEDIPSVGSIKQPEPLPVEVVEWAKRIRPFDDVAAAMAQAVNGPTVFEGYDGFEQDWKAEMAHGAELAQALPGVWGRYAEKVLQVALLYAAAGEGRITREGFEWARRLVRWAAAGFAQHFALEGGGADNELDALGKAFLAVFDTPSFRGVDGFIPASVFAKYSRLWRGCKDAAKRRRVIEALLEDGEITESHDHGVSYRRTK